MFCPNCGTNNSNETVLCIKCGTNLKEIQIQSQNQTQQLVIQGEQSINNQKNNNNKKSNKSKRDFLIIIVILILILIGIILVGKNVVDKYLNYGNKSNADILSIVRDENGIAKFIDGTFTDIKVKSEEDAYKALDTLKNELRFNKVKDEFNIESVEKNDGITYYKFHQKYKNIEVYGMNLIISVDKKGKVLGMNGYYVPNINIDINSKKSEDEIKDIVKKDLGNNVEIVQIEKNIYADNEDADLIYIIDAYSDKKVMEYIINATTGEIIDSYESFEYAAYNFNGKSLDDIVNVTIEEFYDISKLKTRYRLVDPNRNIEIVDASNIGKNLAGITISGIIFDGTPMVGDLDGVNFKYLLNDVENKELAEIGISALKTYEEIYDYYKDVLGRNSYDNKGGKIVVNVGMKIGEEQFNNAAWLNIAKKFYIGYWNGESFTTVKDVLAHEFTHAVISKTAKFANNSKKNEKEKAFETGALNEGIADILGSLIEGKNWTINEDIEIMRSLSNPIIYGYPKVKGGQYYYPDGYLNENKTLEQLLIEKKLSSVSDYDGGGKHHNATVPGHAAYLMYTNGAFSSMQQMAKIWYNSLFLMSSYSNFEDCALAVIKTAKNQGLSSNSIRIIEEAFKETKMLEDNRFEISGVVSNGNKKLKDVKIELKDQNVNYTFTTDVDGKFSGKIESGTYEITFKKEKYAEYKKTITIHGDTTINVELVKQKKQNNKKDKNILKCNSGNCHTITIYFLDNSNNTGIKETYETVSVDDGVVLGSDKIVDELNNLFGDGIFEFDGETFKITIAGFTVDCAWYYRGTNEKFDWNKPITEDIEIEMKMFEGNLDNDFFEDLNDFYENYDYLNK